MSKTEKKIVPHYSTGIEGYDTAVQSFLPKKVAPPKSKQTLALAKTKSHIDELIKRLPSMLILANNLSKGNSGK